MEYKHYHLEELQNMLHKEQNPNESNKIIGAILDKQEVLSNDNEETNSIHLEKETC